MALRWTWITNLTRIQALMDDNAATLRLLSKAVDSFNSRCAAWAFAKDNSHFSDSDRHAHLLELKQAEKEIARLRAAYLAGEVALTQARHRLVQGKIELVPQGGTNVPRPDITSANSSGR